MSPHPLRTEQRWSVLTDVAKLVTSTPIQWFRVKSLNWDRRNCILQVLFSTNKRLDLQTSDRVKFFSYLNCLWKKKLLFKDIIRHLKLDGKFQRKLRYTAVPRVGLEPSTALLKQLLGHAADVLGIYLFIHVSGFDSSSKSYLRGYVETLFVGHPASCPINTWTFIVLLLRVQHSARALPSIDCRTKLHSPFHSMSAVECSENSHAECYLLGEYLPSQR